MGDLKAGIMIFSDLDTERLFVATALESVGVEADPAN